MFNSGQSCCAVERVYVHESIYDRFVEECVRVAKEYKLGDPLDESTTLGPVVSLRSAKAIREHIAEAGELVSVCNLQAVLMSRCSVQGRSRSDSRLAFRRFGERRHDLRRSSSRRRCQSLDENYERRNVRSSHGRHEGERAERLKWVDELYLTKFAQVKDDAEALQLMNDSPYGLTASVWTNDEAAFARLVDDIDAGTVFCNR